MVDPLDDRGSSMIRDLRGRQPGRALLARDAVHAVQYLEAMGHQRPVLLAYHPVARINPYLATLYGGLWERGIAPQPLTLLEELDGFETVLATGVPVILHLHWITGVVESAADENEARANVAEYLARIDRFLAAGGRLIWTVHNILPHDCPFPHLSASLQQAIVDRAELVHVMNPGTAEAVADWFKLPPEKTVHVPHPNYRRAYQDVVPRHQARFDLGLAPDEIVYAAVGSIQPYKGLELLLEAFDGVAAKSALPRRMLIAGAPSGQDEVQGLLDRCLLHPKVVLRPAMVPDVDMQIYLRAADVIVLPYRRTLNSGVLLLALSFGLPVVAPNMGIDSELSTPEVARTFEPGNLESLVTALLAADDLLVPGTREAALRLADRFDPVTVRERFADSIVERMLA